MAKCRVCNQEVIFGEQLCEPCQNNTNWLDRQFSESTGLLVLTALFCNGLALLLSIAGMIGCKDPEAKGKAKIVFAVSLFITLLGLAIGLSK